MNKLQLLSATSFVLLLTSLTANFLLFRELENTYISFYQVSLNPLGIGKYSNTSQSKNAIDNSLSKVVFFGDSRAYGWQFPNNKNWKFVNRGISGQTSAQIRWRFQQHIAPLKPKVIVMQLGVNDLRMLPAKTQTRADIVKNCQQNISQIIELATEIEATVILTTVFPLGSGSVPPRYRPFWASLADMEQNINEINQYLYTLQDRTIILDAHTLLEEKDPKKEKYYRDLLHLNRRGYKMLNQELNKILTEIHTN